MDLMKRAYPFHPELINIFKNKWASHPNFQRTRGVLRLLASVVSDLWRRRHNLVGSQTLIHPSHIYLDNLEIGRASCRESMEDRERKVGGIERSSNEEMRNTGE